MIQRIFWNVVEWRWRYLPIFGIFLWQTTNFSFCLINWCWIVLQKCELLMIDTGSYPWFTFNIPKFRKFSQTTLETQCNNAHAQITAPVTLLRYYSLDRNDRGLISDVSWHCLVLLCRTHGDTWSELTVCHNPINQSAFRIWSTDQSQSRMCPIVFP